MILLLLVALAAGVLLPVQAGVNAQLRSAVGSPLSAALVSFLVGTAGLVTAAVILRAPIALRAAWAVTPWWYWVGGLIGALYVVATIVLAPRLGAATMIAAIVAGQMIASLLLDQYGLLGFPTHAISGVRVLGAALVIVGVILVQH
jgi:bacterial/archaeal transporter family-2 protein